MTIGELGSIVEINFFKFWRLEGIHPPQLPVVDIDVELVYLQVNDNTVRS